MVIESQKKVPKQDRVKYLGQVLEGYMRGQSNTKIADQLGITKQRVAQILDTFRRDYLKTLAIKSIIPRYGHLDEALDEINQPFLDLLTPSDSGALSNQEMLFCTIYVATGNSREAIIKSGLDVGMEKSTADTKTIYDNNVFLRAEFLKKKKNIQVEIRRQQKERSEMREYTKDKLIDLHFDLIEQYREDDQNKHKSAIVKLLDQAARLKGFYTESKGSDDLNTNDLLDTMLIAMEEDKQNAEKAESDSYSDDNQE